MSAFVIGVPGTPSPRSAYLLAFLEPLADGSAAVVKGFGVFSEEHPTIASEKPILSRGAWATIHVEHGADYEDALVAMKSYIHMWQPWIWKFLDERARKSLTQAKRSSPQITR